MKPINESYNNGKQFNLIGEQEEVFKTQNDYNPLAMSEDELKKLIPKLNGKQMCVFPLFLFCIAVIVTIPHNNPNIKLIVTSSPVKK